MNDDYHEWMDSKWPELGAMLIADGLPVQVPGGCGRGDDGILWGPSDRDDWESGGSGSPVPDMRDGPTKGAVLEMARARAESEWLHVAPFAGGWQCIYRLGHYGHRHPTEGEAIAHGFIVAVPF